MELVFDTQFLKGFVSADEIEAMQAKVTAAHNRLHSQDTPEKEEYKGWMTLPSEYKINPETEKIKAAAKKIQADSDVLVVIGIGGSYLGARAVIELVQSKNYNLKAKDTPQVFFAGNSISPAELLDIRDICANAKKGFSINVISKSGTTTESAIAFRIFRELLLKQCENEKEAFGRIYVTTDKEKGALKAWADEQEVQTFVVPDDVGGRYSVLTAVGLLPIAVAGVDIDALMSGALDAITDFDKPSLAENTCYQYAAARNILYSQKQKKIEILVSYEPDFTMMNEWWKQLFGESEGKEHKGIFPASAVYSTDLHSLGQYVQEGERTLFETVVMFKQPKRDIEIPPACEGGACREDDIDELNYLQGRSLHSVNNTAFLATAIAHYDGGVPNMILTLPGMDAYCVGYLIYFFEKACAISGYMLGINPFNQPGVEEYKKNMFALLEKPDKNGGSANKQRKAFLEDKLKNM
ncbi:MAG: glucose-6-phosphate isomerase [Oscillospiraceae bacterium]|jgi:glucose-6-phosphate isomerase|nr:glucose-6-phosphate isomerase [Oscillospiraceae bacterium]